MVGRCLDEIVYTYDLAEDLSSEMFLLSILGLTVPACWYIPRCAVTCGALALAYDYYFHDLFVVDSRTEESFAADLRRWVSLRRERGLSGRELAVAGVALCLAAFAAGYWVVVTVETVRGIGVAALLAGGAPRAAWAWEWLRYGARCIFGLMGTVGYWFLLNGARSSCQGRVRGGWRWRPSRVAWRSWRRFGFMPGTIVVGFAWLMTVYLGVYGESVSAGADKESVMKLFCVLALVMEPGAVAAAARAEFLGEGEQFGIIGPGGTRLAGLRRRHLAPVVRASRAGRVGLPRQRRAHQASQEDAWFIDAGCVLAIYFGGQALMQLGSLLCALGQLEAVYAMGRA